MKSFTQSKRKWRCSVPTSSKNKAAEQALRDFKNRRKQPHPPVRSWRASVGFGKSRLFRAKAIEKLNMTKHDGCVVIAVDHHALSNEQLQKFAEEHPNTALV